MKTFLVFKKTFNESNNWEHTGYVETYASEYEAETIESWIDNHESHFELLAGLDKEVVFPVLVGESYELQEDAVRVAAKIEATKTAEITEAYTTMDAEVRAQMNTIFGTTSADSSNAYHQTWVNMIDSASSWSDKGLTARFAVGGLSVGDPLDTDAKVLNYATTKNAEVDAYAIWRMQRIEAFRVERAAILAS